MFALWCSSSSKARHLLSVSLAVRCHWTMPCQLRLTSAHSGRAQLERASPESEISVRAVHLWQIATTVLDWMRVERTSEASEPPERSGDRGAPRATV